jgi:hypothetical protein
MDIISGGLPTRRYEEHDSKTKTFNRGPAATGASTAGGHGVKPRGGHAATADEHGSKGKKRIAAIRRKTHKNGMNQRHRGMSHAKFAKIAKEGQRILTTDKHGCGQKPVRPQ